MASTLDELYSYIELYNPTSESSGSTVLELRLTVAVAVSDIDKQLLVWWIVEGFILHNWLFGTWTIIDLKSSMLCSYTEMASAIYSHMTSYSVIRVKGCALQNFNGSQLSSGQSVFSLQISWYWSADVEWKALATTRSLLASIEDKLLLHNVLTNFLIFHLFDFFLLHKVEQRFNQLSWWLIVYYCYVNIKEWLVSG